MSLAGGIGGRAEEWGKRKKLFQGRGKAGRERKRRTKWRRKGSMLGPDHRVP